MCTLLLIGFNHEQNEFLDFLWQIPWPFVHSSMFVQITCFATYADKYPSYGRSFCNYNLSYHGNGKSINVFLTRMVYDIQLVVHIPTSETVPFPLHTNWFRNVQKIFPMETQKIILRI